MPLGRKARAIQITSSRASRPRDFPLDARMGAAPALARGLHFMLPGAKTSGAGRPAGGAAQCGLAGEAACTANAACTAYDPCDVSSGCDAKP